MKVTVGTDPATKKDRKLPQAFQPCDGSFLDEWLGEVVLVRGCVYGRVTSVDDRLLCAYVKLSVEGVSNAWFPVHDLERMSQTLDTPVQVP